MNKNLDSNSERAHIQLEQAIHGNKPEAYASRVTKKVEEAKELVETRFEYIFDIDGIRMVQKK